MDRTLMLVVDSMPDATWPERSAELSSRLQLAITDDMMRNRHRRITQDIELAKSTPPPRDIEVPAVPEGDYVGFDIAYFDIETTGLGAYGSEMTCVSIVDQFGRATTRDKFEFEQASILDDRGLCVWLRKELEKYDILVAWYGSQFDLAYINARLIIHGERPIADRMFLDPIYKARGGRYGLKMGGSKLKTVAKALRLSTEKPDVEWETFRLAGYGDPDALAEVRHRSHEDVYILRDIFHRFKPMIRTIHR
jgi:uncharacterized protein YprB with RNaseH-like and TPR domain